MRTIKNLSVLLMLTAMPFFAIAHDGHGIFEGNSLVHYMLNPMHSIPFIAVILVVAIVLYRRRQVAKK